MTFTPGIATTATHGHLFAVTGQELHVIRTEAGVTLPTGPATEDTLYLGELDGEACFAVHIARDEEPLAGTTRMTLRTLFGALTDEQFGVAGRALGLTGWDHDHRFCGRCGRPTRRSFTERTRVCIACEHSAYPRLSPAVIMLVERDGKALLGRNAQFPVPFFSTLAGFVEVGETLEETVAREVKEEAGIAVTNIRYFGSQPWPFTSSLMIGFIAEWAGGEIVVDPTELAEAGWFPPTELPMVPPKLSIARALIDDFVQRRS